MREDPLRATAHEKDFLLAQMQDRCSFRATFDIIFGVFSFSRRWEALVA
jgi:hypothetical protein